MKRLLVFCFGMLLFSQVLGGQNNIYVGAYLNDITSFDLNEGRFKADLFVWVKWLGTEELPAISFANGEIDLQEELSLERDGDWNSVKWRMQGTFRGTFPLQDFPFDDQTLKIQIDLPAERGMLMPDLAGSGMSEEFSITGWIYDPLFKAEILPLTYFSDFGSIANEGIPFKVNTVTLRVHLHRPMAGLIAKYILPLLIIVSIAIGSIFLPTESLDARIDICVNALIACVAFQFAISTSVPDVSYLVVADNLFIMSYLIILTSILTVIFNYKIQLKNEKRAKLIDRLFLISMPCIILFFTLWQISDIHTTEEKEFVSEQQQNDQIVNYQDTLVIGRPVTHVSHYHSLFQRGLYHKVKGDERAPHLVAEVPALTNDLVSFFPDGSMSVKWIFKPGVKWGDGAPITMDDILFSMKVHNDLNVDTLIQLPLEDQLGIEIRYKRRLSNVLDKFELYPKAQFEAAFEAGGADSMLNLRKLSPPPMDGPYILHSIELGKQAIFMRNPHYVGQPARIPFVKILAIKGSTNAIKANISDVSYYVTMDTKMAADSLPNYEGQIDDSYKYAFLIPDLNYYPFNIPEVRKAIACAINRDSVRYYGKDGLGSFANAYVPPTVSGYLEKQDYYVYDPDRARQLLQKAGVKKGEPLRLVNSFYKEGNVDKPTCDYMKRALEQVGFKVTVEKESVWGNQKKGDFKCLMYRSSSYSDEDLGYLWNMKYVAELGGVDFSAPQGMFNEEIFQLYQRYKASLFPERRIAISRQMQLKFIEELPTIPLLFEKEMSYHRKNLHGWEPMAVEGDRWWNIEFMYFSDPNKEEKEGMREEEQ